MKTRRSAYAVAAAALVGVAGLVGTTAAQARDHVSIGLALPGISIGVGQPAPYYGPRYYPAPTYYAPAAPVTYYGETGYVSGPTYYAPPPVVYAPPPPVYYGRPYYGPRYYRY